MAVCLTNTAGVGRLFGEYEVCTQVRLYRQGVQKVNRYSNDITKATLRRIENLLFFEVG